MKNPDSSSTKTLLVVDDEAPITDICRRVLANEGFEVDIAENGRVAQELIDKKQYALCLMDIRTPVMNGMELFLWLKDKHPDMVKGVIFTTGDLMGGVTTDFIEGTGRPLLPKPFTPDELKAKVNEALEEIT